MGAIIVAFVLTLLGFVFMGFMKSAGGKAGKSIRSKMDKKSEE